MRGRDLLALSLEALAAHRLRYGLSALAVAVGVAAVVLLSALGEGTRRYVRSQLTIFGTTIVSVNPGHVETTGVPGAMGGSTRRLTLDDARALARLPGVLDATPFAMGSALVEAGDRGRRTLVFGVGGTTDRVWSMQVATGRFLPDVDWERAGPVAVLGPTVRRELFGDANPLGQFVRVGRERYRVIGVMASKGQFLGIDIDDIVYVPVANGLRLFNKSEVDEIDLLAASVEESESLAARARRLMIERHDDDDVTVMTQKDALDLLDGIMRVLAGTVTGIAAVSLVVGAIGIFTILWIVVQERVQEIGLVMALGARRRQVLAWYLCEAALTAGTGGAAGLLVGATGAALIGRFVPGASAQVTPGVIFAALAMAIGVGLVAGVAPALRAARLDPVVALAAE